MNDPPEIRRQAAGVISDGDDEDSSDAAEPSDLESNNNDEGERSGEQPDAQHLNAAEQQEEEQAESYLNPPRAEDYFVNDPAAVEPHVAVAAVVPGQLLQPVLMPLVQPMYGPPQVPGLMLLPPPPPPPLDAAAPHPVMTMAQYYEAKMRDSAAAYANAAAGAAWAAAHLAAVAAEFAATGTGTGAPLSGGAVAGWNHPAYGPMAVPFPPPPWQPPDGVDVHNVYSNQPYSAAQPFGHESGFDAPQNIHSRRQQQHTRSLRKRHERPPSDDSSTVPCVVAAAAAMSPNNGQSSLAKSRGTVRRRFRDGDSSTTSSGSWLHRKPHHNKKKARNESLLGKTAVSALYEWCAKREQTLAFEYVAENSEYECLVRLDENDTSLGSGRGRTKAAAKSIAARRALQALLPGVVLDEATGILTHLPDPRRETSNAASASLEDLAPNLAKRLAIGRDDDDTPENRQVDSKRLKSQRAWNVYPGTSTTSEEEDDNSYFASRGASVCSALLHAMIQINPSISGPPDFQFEVAPLPPSSANLSLNSTATKPRIRFQRGPFTCTARLRIAGQVSSDSQKSDSSQSHTEGVQETVLEATGIGGTKRESRHIASARLLALLFPECNSMVEVKAAAEAAREAYAATKSRKPQPSSSARRIGRHVRELRLKRSAGLALHHNDDPALPPHLAREFRVLLGWQYDGLTKATHNLHNHVADSMDATDSAFRRLTRQKQFDALVEAALQAFNEKDEEGRSLPEELSDDDVGRTILRRALPEDLGRIKKLLLTESSDFAAESLGYGAISSATSNYWTSSSIALLLCRAIAAFEDPPLGCAILTLGFNMEHGRLLRVAKLAIEQHLPRERFVERLQDFAVAMKCQLDVDEGLGVDSRSRDVFSSVDLTRIVESYLSPGAVSRTETCLDGGMEEIAVEKAIKQVSSTLQSVQEESELSESSADKKPTKPSSKPSKRSRVA